MASGIYLLRFTGTDKVYIGQSVNLASRKMDHFRNLKNGCSTKKLQEAYRIHGMPTFEVILEVPTDELDSCENEAIALWNSVNNGFNTLVEAKDAPTDGMPGETHWNAKYSNSDIILLVEYLVSQPHKSLSQVAKDLEMSYSVVKDVAGGRKHLWLREYNETLYKALLDSIGTRSFGVSAKDRGIKYPPIISPSGIVYYITNINKFAKEHNLNSGGLYKVLTGVNKSCKGYTLYTI